MTPDWAATPTPIPYAQMGNPQTLNLYSYVQNNPITGIDPDGHADPPKPADPCIGNGQCAYDRARNEKKEKPPQYSGQFFGKALTFLNSAVTQTKTAANVAGTAIGKWIGMEYAIGLQQDKAEKAARAKMTAEDYLHQWMFAMMVGKAAAPEVTVAREGEFSIIGWEGYPNWVPKPSGTFRLIEGMEYTEARQAANAANGAIHKATPEISPNQIHEIKPVKFAGSPTDPANKMVLTPQQHSVVSAWWNQLKLMIMK